MSTEIIVFRKDIKVIKSDDGKFTVDTFLNGKKKCGYAYGSLKWAAGLAECISNDDNIRAYVKNTPQFD